MKKTLLALLLTFGSLQATFAAIWAIAPCEHQSNKDIVNTCRELNLEVIGTDQKGFTLVRSEVFPQGFCYATEVRQSDRFLMYNTNTLLVKMSEGSVGQLGNYILIANRFIPNLYSLHTDAKNEAELLALRESLSVLPGVEYVSMNQVFSMDLNVNDPLYPRQWNIENTGSAIQGNGTPGADMSVDSAWTITTGNSIRIGILDSGVDTLHEDLIGKFLPGFDGYATDSTDTHGFPTPNYQMDGHGTSCAGIAAASGDNNLGIAGISYGSSIIPVRVFYYFDYGPGIGVQATTTTDGLLNGAAYAWRDAFADVISCSAGLPDLYIGILGIDTVLINTELTAAFYQGRNWKGVPMFFSSGNDDASDVLWPAKLQKTIGIGASSMCDERKSTTSCDGENWGSNYGPGLDCVAPGVKISTTDMTGSPGFSAGNYTYTFNGTSAACPNAAGVGALILDVNPTLSAEDVRAILNITATRVTGYTYDSITPYGTWNNAVGHGRINAYAAVQLAQTYVSTAGISESNELNVSIYPNPTDGSINVYYPNEENARLIIRDLNGKTIVVQNIEGSGVYAINLDAAVGIYLMTIRNSQMQKTVRVVRR